MDLVTARNVCQTVGIVCLAITVGAGAVSLASAIQVRRYSRKIDANAPYEAAIASAKVTLSVVISSSVNVNSLGYGLDIRFWIDGDSGPLLLAKGTECRTVQRGDDRVEYSATLDSETDDVCMGKIVRSLADGVTGRVRFRQIGQEEVLEGEVVLLLNGSTRFDIPIPAQQLSDLGVISINGIGEILVGQMPQN